jgi:hypothetical protein
MPESPSTPPVSTRGLDGAQALRLFQAGTTLQCRLCRALLVPIPEMVSAREAHGLKCPTNANHFLVYGEPEGPMKAMRAAMRRAVAGKK